MRRRILTALAAAPVLLLLTACDPGMPAPTPSGSAPSTVGATTTPAPSQTAEAIPVPDDATMVVTARATASTGATLDLRLVVHRSVPWGSAAEEATAATVAWCQGEVDADVISTLDTRVDYSATAVSGSWPAAETIWLHPTPTYTTLAATGAATSVAYPDGQTPRCARPAILAGAGAGATFLGAEGDTGGRDGLPPLQFWSRLTYGFNNDFTLAAPTITFTGCAAQVTELGASLGAPGDGWHEDFLPNSCIVGGMTGY